MATSFVGRLISRLNGPDQTRWDVQQATRHAGSLCTALRRLIRMRRTGGQYGCCEGRKKVADNLQQPPVGPGALSGVARSRFVNLVYVHRILDKCSEIDEYNKEEC